jgi:hypothetical protein
MADPKKLELPPGATLDDGSQGSSQLPPGATLDDGAPAATLPTGSASAAPKPFTIPWFKEKYKTLAEKGMDALPTVGGVLGGFAGGGAGLETGPGAIATATAGAAAGQGLGEAVRQEMEQIAFPDQPKLSAKDSAKKIGTETAIGGASELAGRVASKALAPVAKSFKETAMASKASGIDLLPSEAAGKPPSFLEKVVKGHVFTGGKMQRFRDVQNQQTQAAVSKIADGISKFQGTSEDLGNLVQQGIKAHTMQFRQVQNAMYDAIDQSVNKRTIRVPEVTRVEGTMEPDGRHVMKNVVTMKDKVVDDVMPSTAKLKQFAREELDKLNETGVILDPQLLEGSKSMLEHILNAPDRMSFSGMASARSDALAKVRELDQAMAGKQAGLAKKMAGLFDDAMIEGAEKSKIPGLVDDVRAANKFTAEEHRRFEQALVEKVAETKKPEIIATLLRGKSIGNQELRDLFTVMPKELHPLVQQQMLVDTMRQSTDSVSKVFDEGKFAKAIGNIGEERGKIIFGSNWNNIQQLAKVLERVNGPTGLGGGGAALQNMQVIRAIVASAYLLPLGLATGGHIEGGAITLAGQYIGLRAMANLFTHPELAAKMIKALRVGGRVAPYAANLGANEAGLNNTRAKVQQEWDKHFTAPQAPTAPVAPSATAPAPAATPPPPQIHFEYDPDSDELVPR